MNKNEILRVAANEFAEKVHKLSSPRLGMTPIPMILIWSSLSVI